MTVHEVARKAKVAPSTVSLVANQAGRVSEKTRRRVAKIIQEMGYRPRSTRPRGKDVGQYAAVYAVSNLSPSSHMSTLTEAHVEGVASVFSGTEGSMSVVGVWGLLPDDPVLRTTLRSKQLDGLILMGVYPEAEENLRFIAELGIPVVAINRIAANGEFSGVTADYYHGMRTAVAHLADRGHKRFAFSGLSRHHWPTLQRCRGMQDELAARQLPAAQTRVGEGYLFSEEQNQTAQFCIEQVEKGVTALLLVDGPGKTAAEALVQRGIRIPQDVSIIGCDGLNIEIGPDNLSLSTLDFDKRYLGELAARTVIELHRNQSRLSSITRTIPMRLIEGQTVADRFE